MDVRRIVTGHDADGKAIVVSDGPTPNVLKPDNRPGVEIHNLWVLDESPAKVHGPEESVDRKIGLLPPKNGSVFRVIKFPPEKDWIDDVDAEAAKSSFASIGAEGASDQGEPPHPLMHKTETVDYAIYLRADLSPGMRLTGPALIVEDQTTTVVTSPFDLSVNGIGYLILTRTR